MALCLGIIINVLPQLDVPITINPIKFAESRLLGRNSVALLIPVHDRLGKRDAPIPGSLKKQTGLWFAASTRPRNLWMVWAIVKGIYVRVELCPKHLVQMPVKAAHILFGI